MIPPGSQGWHPSGGPENGPDAPRDIRIGAAFTILAAALFYSAIYAIAYALW